MPKIRFWPRLCPGPCWRSSQRTPDPLVGWGGDTPSRISFSESWQPYIDYSAPEDNGWQLTDDGLVPLWFFCSQFPPSLCKKPPKKSVDVCAEEADDESPDTERKKQLWPPKKKHKKEAATSSNENDRISAIDISSSSSESDSSEFLLNSS